MERNRGNAAFVRVLLTVWTALFLVIAPVVVKGQAEDKGVPWGHPKANSIPAEGEGRFGSAEGSSPVVGEGKRLRFKVEVEFGVGEHADRFATLVEEILFDPRSWSGSDSYALQRVDTGPVDFRVTLASPKTVDRRCQPLDTEGIYSCWNGNRAMINLWRWYSGHPIFPSLSEYRAHVINHEVGHALGRGHTRKCSAIDEKADVMMQQTINLNGCESNAWVRPDRSTDSLKRAYARVLSDTLYFDMLSPDTDGSSTPSNKRQLAGAEATPRSVDVRKLRRIIVRFLYYDYVDRHGLTSTDTEVKTLARTLRKRAFWLPEQSDFVDLLPSYIRHWKFRQQLYTRYGGSVRQDLFGFVPEDAYQQFLKEREQAGDFEIYVDDVAEEFWSLSPANTLFLTVPVRREQPGVATDNPPWM